MTKLLLVALLFSVACNQKSEKIHLPSELYHYDRFDTASMQIKKSVYVPIYSHIYSQSGTRLLNLTATLSIRNTDYDDSFYISKVLYYDSQGKLLKQYIDSPIFLKALSSIEFVVEEKESEGGAGANFVVQWYSPKAGTAPLIQAVMTGTNTGVSFTTEAVEMK